MIRKLLAATGMILLAVVAGAAPVVGPLRVLTPEVARYERFELAADITGNWQNAFDPEQVDVQAEFAGPGGKHIKVPAFWYQNYVDQTLTSKPRQQVDLLKLFINEKQWIAGTKVEFFVDDIALVDEAGKETPFDDMEQGETPRAGAGAAPPLAFATDIVHGGKRSLRFAPEPEGNDERWPGMSYALANVDWSGYSGVVLWVYPRCQTPLGPVQVYTHDKEWGNSEITGFGPQNGALVANQWNRLVWRFKVPAAPVKLVPQGKPEWRVRFTPVTAGNYTVKLTARDKDGATESEAKAFAVKPSAEHGFVRVSEKDPHYFVFEDGTPFFAIGHDVAWHLADVKAYLPKMHANGENAMYFILFPGDLQFEWDKLGEYNLEQAARLDRVLDTARDNGIYLKLSFDCHDAWRPSSQWGKSPYNARNGGPCATPNDLYTSPQAWAYYTRRLRYLAARWGYSPNMMAWEPVAELDGATQLDGTEGWRYPYRPGGEKVSAMVAPFLQKLSRYLDTQDPYGRLFTTSFGGDVSDDNHWRLPEIKYTQIHCYDQADPSDTLSRWVRELTTKFRKPMLVTEFGWVTTGPKAGEDPEGINLHNGIWASAMSGAAGAAFDWWWEVIDANNLYRHYPPLKAFIEGVNWPEEGFRPVEAQLQVPDQQRTAPVSTMITGQGGFGDVTVEEYPITAGGTLVESASRPPVYLLGRGRSEKRVAPRFLVNFPRPSTFALEIGSVSPDARLEMRLDGQTVKTVDLPVQNVPGKISTFSEQWKVWACRYDESYIIEVPAGPHEIQVENTHPGSSWIQVTDYRVTRQEPPTLRAMGLCGKANTLVWVQNLESMWYNWKDGAPRPIRGAELKLQGLPAGRLTVRWLDTWTGQTLQTADVESKDGVVSLRVPPVSRDLACRLTRR